MDLKDLGIDRAEQGVEMVVEHPTKGTPLVDEETNEPWTITLLGADSDMLRNLSHKSTNKRLSRAFKGGRRNRVATKSEELEEDALDILVAATTGWKHITLGGEKIPCTKDRVREVYTLFPWIREQADEFINDRSNYLGN